MLLKYLLIHKMPKKYHFHKLHYLNFILILKLKSLDLGKALKMPSNFKEFVIALNVTLTLLPLSSNTCWLGCSKQQVGEVGNVLLTAGRIKKSKCMIMV